MNLNCINDIVTDNLAIHIDVTKTNSWDLNTGFTLISLTKWNNAIVDDIKLDDFGLTSYDNGRFNKMYSGLTLNQNDNKLILYRVGYNTSTGGTFYNGYAISGVTGSSVGRYLSLNGGYFQGFFKLDNYNYELFAPRYNNGITIETIIEILPQSSGIFYYMGTRSEDKYNNYFSGETTIINSSNILYGGNFTGYSYQFDGVITSENNYLVAYENNSVKLNSFNQPEFSDVVIMDSVPQLNNVSNNVISFEITDDKKIKYKYIDANGNIIQNESPNQLYRIGWTIIDIVFRPYDIIKKYDSFKYSCYPRRKGDMLIYVNGRMFWKIKDFDEFYFKGLDNDREKQLGVPYNIGWGGGSFGLKHSWHYDINDYFVYTGQNTNFIQSNFIPIANPIPTKCNPTPSGNYLAGLSLSANSTMFTINDECNPNTTYPITVMSIEYTGTTGSTGNTGSTYFVKYIQPISVLSNRDYEINLSIFDSGFFNSSVNDNFVYNKISLLVYGNSDVNIVDDIVYKFPIYFEDIADLERYGLRPFPDRQEYQYMYNGTMYYGVTGIPIINETIFTYGIDSNYLNLIESIKNEIVTGQNEWKKLKCKFRLNNNVGKQMLNIGILIESTNSININKPIYIKDFTYTAADVLSQDASKNNLLIENYFDSSFIGNLQKLRIYNAALQPDEILHNAIVESKNNPAYGMLISKGGRIIQQYQNVPYIPQQSSGSDIRKSIRYRNSDGSFKDLYQMLDIKVIVKSRSNPTVELVKFKKISEPGWLQLIWVNDTTYDFIVPNTITSSHPNETLFAEIKFQWADPLDIDNVFDKIFVTNITTTNLLDNTIKNY